MFEIKGKYGTAKFFADLVDDETIGQVMRLLNQKSTEGSKVRIMADCHAGVGCVIGTTMTITDKIIPNLVGVDIGCGMEAVKLQETNIDYKKLDETVRKYIPSGFCIRDSIHPYEQECRLEELFCLKQINLERARLSLGSLGGGNHFIEVDESENGAKFLVIHTGSRYLGKQVAEYYQDLAWKNLSKEKINEQIQKEIVVLKAEGREKEISETIAKIKASFQNVPKELAYCEGQLFENYIHDMKIVQEFATLNRQAIADVIVKQMNLHVSDSFTTIHNYIDTDAMILRKGSVSAKEGEKLIIPINMRDGSLICIGKGNEDYNFSAPHGAGRLMSRSQAKSILSVDEFQDEMKEAGVFTTSCGQATLDEAPGAYKPMESILENIKDTVEVVEVIKPVV